MYIYIYRERERERAREMCIYPRPARGVPAQKDSAETELGDNIVLLLLLIIIIIIIVIIMIIMIVIIIIIMIMIIVIINSNRYTNNDIMRQRVGRSRASKRATDRIRVHAAFAL